MDHLFRKVMATGSDVRDILDLEDQPTGNLSRRDVLFGAADKPKRKSNAKPLVKKPEGLSREVWGLLYSDSRDPPPIVPTDNAAAGYKQVCACAFVCLRLWVFVVVFSCVCIFSC